MADTNHTPPEPRHGSTRRGFLGHLAGVAAAGAIVQVGVPATVSADERIEAAVETIRAAMVEIHGEGCEVIRNGNHLVSVISPPKPRIVEFAGAGYYEVEQSKTVRPIYYVERYVAHDSLTAGRCYRLTPRDAKHLGTHFMFEGDLRLALIRKI